MCKAEEAFMQRTRLALITTLIFTALAFVPTANAGQNCADGSWSSSNKISACAKHGGVLSATPTPKPKTTTSSTSESATNTQSVTTVEPTEKSIGKIPGLCSRINKYAPGTC